VIGWRQVRRFGVGGIQLLDSLLAGGANEIAFLTSQKDVVGNAAEELVARTGGDDGAEAIFQVVAAGGFQADSIAIEPGAPEDSTQPVDMAVEHASDIVAAGEVHDALNWRKKEELVYELIPHIHHDLMVTRKGGRGKHSGD
jgi:hypothetical protein